MSDNGEVEVEAPTGYQILPKDVTAEIGSIKLFNKWSYEDVEIRDISLTYEFTLYCSSSDLALFSSSRRIRRWKGQSGAGRKLQEGGIRGKAHCLGGHRG